MSTETILVHRDGHIVTVTLNRPEKLNALTKPMWQRLGEVFTELSADATIRCIVIRGAGERAFAPGNDISEFENERSDVEQARAYGRIMHTTIGADPRHLRRRRPGNRRARRHPHLRRVEPLWRADQKPRPGDGLR